MTRTAFLARLERERLLRLEARGRARAEALAVETGVAETVALSRARGAEIEPPEQGEGPYRRMSGLSWLARKGKISPEQARAGAIYGACYRKSMAEAAIGSSLGIEPGGGGGTALSLVAARAEGRVVAAAKLAAMRARLLGQKDLVAACDLVCGRELTPREAAGGDRAAGRLEAVLGVALDVLAGA